MPKQYNKPALTFDHQLKKLESRGMAIADREEALKQLASISYYRLSGYSYPFRERNDQGNGDTRAKDVTDLLETIAIDKRWRAAMGMPENWKKHPVWK